MEILKETLESTEVILSRDSFIECNTLFGLSDYICKQKDQSRHSTALESNVCNSIFYICLSETRSTSSTFASFELVGCNSITNNDCKEKSLEISCISKQQTTHVSGSLICRLPVVQLFCLQ